MTQSLKALTRLAFLSILWMLLRFTQFCLEVSGLSWEAGEVSNAELFLHSKIERLLTSSLRNLIYFFYTGATPIKILGPSCFAISTCVCK